jgi:hypothetical protein
MKIDAAVTILKGYCKPYSQGGAGDNGLTEAIECVLAEKDPPSHVSQPEPSDVPASCSGCGDFFPHYLTSRCRVADKFTYTCGPPPDWCPKRKRDE